MVGCQGPLRATGHAAGGFTALRETPHDEPLSTPEDGVIVPVSGQSDPFSETVPETPRTIPTELADRPIVESRAWVQVDRSLATPLAEATPGQISPRSDGPFLLGDPSVFSAVPGDFQLVPSTDLVAAQRVEDVAGGVPPGLLVEPFESVGHSNLGPPSCVPPPICIPSSCSQPTCACDDHCGPPAKDGCVARLTFRDDARGFGGLLKDDFQGLLTWNNAAILAAAAGGAIAVRQELDGRVRDYTERHSHRWGNTSTTLGKFGDVPVQIPALAGIYGYSLWTQDAELHDFSSALISAYTITGVSTVLLKVAVNTERPTDEWNGGQYGFPSYHTASSFAIASVIDEYYGHRAGLPAYAFAGLIGWSRIDERDHDLSDVLFGSVLGYVIGKSVAGRHLRCDPNVRIFPYFHPTDGTPGVMWERRF